LEWLNQNLRALQVNIEDPYGYFADRITSESLVSLAESLKANVLVVFARDSWGRVFYRGSAIYPLHRRTSLYVEDLVSHARRKGIQVVIMVDHTANRFIYRKHPSWAQVNIDGEVVVLEHYPAEERVRDPHWPQICPNSPALEKFFVPEAEEAIRITDADGVLLDSFRYLPDSKKACFCSFCRERFKRETGLDLPRRLNEEDEAYRLAWEWRYKITREAISKIKEAVTRVKPETPLLYNSHPGGWAGRGNRVLEGVADIIDGVFAEATETDFKGPGFLTFITKLNRGIVGGEKPVFVSRNAFYMLRVPQSPPPLHVKMGLWEIFASGGKPWVTVFSSQLFTDPRSLEAVGEVYETIDRIGEYMVGKRPLRHVGLVFSNVTHDWYLHAHPEYYVGETIGFSLMMMHSHMPFEIIPDSYLEDLAKLAEFKCIVLANTGVLSEKAEKTLKRYVESGGTIIGTHEVGVLREDLTYREALALDEVFGVSYEGPLKWGYIYLDLVHEIDSELRSSLWNGLPEAIPLGDASSVFRRERADPMLGESVRLVARSAKPLAFFRIAKSAYGYEYTLGRSTPAPGRPLGMPAIVLNEHGRGRALYYAFRLGLHYDRLGHPDYLELFRRPLEALVATPLKTNAPPTVQVEVYKGKDEMIVHLVNHTFNQRMLDAPSWPSRQTIPAFDPYYSIHPITTIIPLRGIYISIRWDGSEKVLVRDAIEGSEDIIVAKNGWAEIPISELREYKMLVIEPRG